MQYENMLLIDSELEPHEADEFIRKIRSTIEKAGGKIIKTDNWGKKKCAYLVNKPILTVFTQPLRHRRQEAARPQ